MNVLMQTNDCLHNNKCCLFTVVHGSGGVSTYNTNIHHWLVNGFLPKVHILDSTVSHLNHRKHLSGGGPCVFLTYKPVKALSVIFFLPV